MAAIRLAFASPKEGQPTNTMKESSPLSRRRSMKPALNQFAEQSRDQDLLNKPKTHPGLMEEKHTETLSPRFRQTENTKANDRKLMTTSSPDSLLSSAEKSKGRGSFSQRRDRESPMDDKKKKITRIHRILRENKMSLRNNADMPFSKQLLRERHK